MHPAVLAVVVVVCVLAVVAVIIGVWFACTPSREDGIYQLADLVYGIVPAKRAYKYPDSIAAKYCTAAKRPPGWTARIEEKYDHFSMDLFAPLVPAHDLDDNHVLVHVRIGEVIEDTDVTVDEYLAGEDFVVQDATDAVIGITGTGKGMNGKGDGVPRGYVRPLHYYDHVASMLPPHIRRVTLVAGVLFPQPLPKSKDYVRRVTEHFTSLGYDVDHRVTLEPDWRVADDDFAFLASARHFVPSGGGYSRLAKLMVERRGGQVYEPARESW